jgi:transcriptional regulator GlxA family with amidase domain
MTTRPVAVIAYDGAELLDIACITTPFYLANHVVPTHDAYDVRVVSLDGGPVRTESGLTLHADGALPLLTGPVDTVVVSGGLGHLHAATLAPLLHHVRRLAADSRRVASVCTGTSVLAAAGLLDGRRATTHWRFAADLARRHPEVTVDPDPIFVRDGNVATAAGVTSALDLTLAFIEEDLGSRVARIVAQNLVTYLQRPGNQAQMSLFTTQVGAADEHGTVREAVGFITTHLDGDLSTAAVAAAVGVSPRHLGRLFRDHTGRAPAQFVRRARIEAAARLLESTTLPVATVAHRCGFRSAEALRQSFAGHYATSPTSYRTRFARAAAEGPAP